jgi:hypothetical protein
VITLATDLYFEIDGVTCRDELRGSSVQRTRSDVRVRLHLPRSADPDDSDPRSYKPTTALVELFDGRFEARILRVVATVDVADDWDERNEVEVRGSLVVLAEQFARDFHDWVRVIGGQQWLPPPGERPVLVSAARLLKRAGDQEAYAFPTIVLPGGTIRVIPPDAVLGRATLQTIDDALQRSAPEPDELLLADAQYSLESGNEGDAAKAVLLAAIALESRMRRLLPVIADDAQVGLVDLLIEGPRDWTLSAHSMFIKAIPAVYGGPPTDGWAEVGKRVQKLFEARNKVAHKGERIDRAEASGHIAATLEAFAQLETAGIRARALGDERENQTRATRA